MKTIMTLCFMMALAFNLNAQEKPSKKQTIEFMNTVLNGAKGTEMSDGFFIDEVRFDGNMYSYSCGKKMGSAGFKFEHLNIPWHEFKEFDSDHTVDDGIVSIRPQFNIKVEGAIYLYDNGTNEKSATYQEGFVLIIPEAKAESFKMAVRRLIELAKEENADPFAKPSN